MGASQNVTFNDSSEYIYRNSSRKRGGFEGNIGNVKTTTNLDIDGTEDILREQELLSTAERTRVADMITAMTACATDALCGDKADLKTKAEVAWNRAINLYPEHKAQLDTLLDDLKTETIARICLAKTSWARAAGSSLNCLVLEMESKAQIELGRRIAGAIAESHVDLRKHETEAMARAFADNLNARLEPVKLALNQIGTLYSILRGATVLEMTDRNYTEDRGETTNQFTLMGKFYHESEAIADSNGTYESDASDAVSAAQAIQGFIPTT